MGREPVAVAAIVRTVVLIAGLFGYTQLEDAINEMGGLVAVAGAIAVISGVIDYLVRGRVSPE